MIIHTIIALAIQIAFWFAFGSLLPGAAAGSIMFLMREVTQAEYKWIKAYGSGKRANMPWWGGFDYRVWNLKSLTDWLVPAIVVWAVFILL